MKVAFYVYPTAFQSPGGGEILLLKTKEYLEKAGVRVTLLDIWHDKLQDFDILHTFGSVKDALRMMETARGRGVKNVLSSICWHSFKAAWGAETSFTSRCSGLARHAAKALFPTLPSQRKRMLDIADMVLPNSQAEARQLNRFFKVTNDKIRIVYNGVDERFAAADPSHFRSAYGVDKFVLCVGRIEPRKNQLNVVRALRGLDIPVLFIGDPVPGYENYFMRCKTEASANIRFLPGIPHDSPLLPSAYAACEAFVLATWLETPGLAALEAGLAGTRIIITSEGSTREYFQDFVSYVNPSDPRDIHRATLTALAQSRNSSLSRHVMNNFLWTQAAESTLAAYHAVITPQKEKNAPHENSAPHV